LFPVVNFLKGVRPITEVVCFQLLLLRHWHFTRYSSDTLELWWDL